MCVATAVVVYNFMKAGVVDKLVEAVGDNYE
jgi:hypothetical protein